MSSYNIELNSKPKKGSNEHTLLLRITVNRKHARLRLDHAIQPKHFNQNPNQNKYIRSSHSKHAIINRDIDDKIQEAKEAAKDLEKEKKHLTAESIKQRMNQADYSSIIEFANSVIKTMEKNNQVGSVKKYKTLINKLSEFTKSNDLLFVEITLVFLEEFHAYMRSLGNNETTSSKYLETLRTIYRKASITGLTDPLPNPFFNFKIRRGQVTRTRLNEDEIKEIVELELPKGSLIWHIKNAFLFSFYNAGIRASDLITMQWKNVADGRLTYKMHKTQKVHSVKLLDKPKHILDYYDSDDPDHYIFPFFKNDIDYSDPVFLHNQISAKTALLNKYLKQIATKAGIHKNISTHTARHSFADIARKKTDNLYNLSKTLGHSSLKITESYLASFDEDAIDDTLNSVFD